MSITWHFNNIVYRDGHVDALVVPVLGAGAGEGRGGSKPVWAAENKNYKKKLQKENVPGWSSAGWFLLIIMSLRSCTSDSASIVCSFYC